MAFLRRTRLTPEELDDYGLRVYNQDLRGHLREQSRQNREGLQGAGQLGKFSVRVQKALDIMEARRDRGNGAERE